VPAPCLPLPVCDVNIISSTIGACYFDPADNTSKAELEVCVEWSNRPGTENIVVVIDGPPKQMMLITTTGASGSACVKFIIPANGVYNAGVWVYFQNTTSCGADISYTVPAPCLPLPVCNVNLTSDKCLPQVTATFDGCGKVTICSAKDLSNVVLDLGGAGFQNFATDKKYDNLSGYSRMFTSSQPIRGVWIKSGCNKSGDCPGCGEYIANPNYPCNQSSLNVNTSLELSNAAENTSFATESLEIYPNPTTSELNVLLPAHSGKSAILKIYNSMGQLVRQLQVDELTEEATRVDVSTLNSDMYYLQVQIPSEGIFTQKFVVKR